MLSAHHPGASEFLGVLMVSLYLLGSGALAGRVDSVLNAAEEEERGREKLHLKTCILVGKMRTILTS